MPKYPSRIFVQQYQHEIKFKKSDVKCVSFLVLRNDKFNASRILNNTNLIKCKTNKDTLVEQFVGIKPWYK